MLIRKAFVTYDFDCWFILKFSLPENAITIQAAILCIVIAESNGIYLWRKLSLIKVIRFLHIVSTKISILSIITDADALATGNAFPRIVNSPLLLFKRTCSERKNKKLSCELKFWSSHPLLDSNKKKWKYSLAFFHKPWLVPGKGFLTITVAPLQTSILPVQNHQFYQKS